jgi:putative spermidine/putrescine transport system substrate-binding protein
MRLLCSVVSILAVAFLALAGCGSDTSGGGDGNKGSLTFMSGGGAYFDALNEAYLKPFERDTGVAVNDDPTLSYAKIKTQVKSGNVTIDVTPAEGYFAAQECGKDLQRLDTSIVDLSKVDPELKQDECGAPLITYNTSIYYKKGAFPGKDAPTGCKDFFDTERFPGKRAVRESALPNPLVECALIADGVAADDLYPLDLDRAFKKIATIEDDLIFWPSGADSVQLMTAGEAVMIQAWNGRAYDAIAEQGAAYESAYGDAFLIYDTLVVPKGVKDPESAMRLINSMMDPKRQAKLTSLIPYSPTRVDAKLGELPAKLKEFLPETNPKAQRGIVVQDQRWWAENGEVVTRRWSDAFQG